MIWLLLHLRVSASRDDSFRDGMRRPVSRWDSEKTTRARLTSRLSNMNLTVEIPDDLAVRLNVAGGDLSRRALEALGLEEYKSGHITKAELRRLLGFDTRYELDGFLKAHASGLITLSRTCTTNSGIFKAWESETAVRG